MKTASNTKSGKSENDTKPTVSVILTCYNQASYLADALNSIRQQSYQDFEVIAVDDGSRDKSLDILQSFEREGELIMRVCAARHGENRGIVTTFARGISEANGVYLAFLEADDAWAPNYLSEKVQILDQLPEVGVVFSPCRFLIEGCFGLDMLVRQKVLQWLLPKRQPFDNFKRLLRKNNVATFSTFVARAELVRSVRPPDDSRLCFYDWWLLMHLSLHTQFFFDTRSYTVWRHSRSSFMGNQAFVDHRERLTEFLEVMYRSIEQDLSLRDGNLQRYFTKKRRGMRSFVSFYRQPSLREGTKFFHEDPLWSVETIASYLVNRSKFR